jgi:hypothetical protein
MPLLTEITCSQKRANHGLLTGRCEGESGSGAAVGSSSGWLVPRKGRQKEANGVAAASGGEIPRDNFHSSARQVLLYCFRLGKCGTFMPLSGVRGESRIAGVWTLFVLAFSSISSVHFSILFTKALVFSAADCR